MFFTQEDYRKIYDWIKTHSIKDSEFSDSKPLDGMETITVVQQGHNVKFILQDFLEQLALLNIPDFVNVTERYDLKYISLFEATKAIPYRSRKIGQVITFLDEDGNWKIYQFRGEKRNQWNILTLWVDTTVTQNSFPYKSGTFANKPTEVDVGYAYFCTDKQTTEGTTNGIMIYHKGDNVWVDALGRVVS